MAGGFLSPGSGKANDKIAEYGRGRVCEVADCETVLSTYNPERWCSVHVVAGAPDRRP